MIIHFSASFSRAFDRLTDVRSVLVWTPLRVPMFPWLALVQLMDMNGMIKRWFQRVSSFWSFLVVARARAPGPVEKLVRDRQPFTPRRKRNIIRVVMLSWRSFAR